VRSFSGQLLRAQRVRCGLSVADLAARTGRSPWAVYDYETGRAQPPIPVATVLADAVGVSLDVLLADDRQAVTV
jgi:ribosome-binding protein aMBF1 (putative translation factor)